MTPRPQANSEKSSPQIDAGNIDGGPQVNPRSGEPDSILEQTPHSAQLTPLETDRAQEAHSELLDQDQNIDLRLMQFTGLNWRRELMALAMLLEQDRFDQLVMEKCSFETRFTASGNMERSLELIVQNVVSVIENQLDSQLLENIVDVFQDDELVAQAVSDVQQLLITLRNFAHTTMDFGAVAASVPAYRMLRGEEIDQLQPFVAELRLRLNILANCLP